MSCCQRKNGSAGAAWLQVKGGRRGRQREVRQCLESRVAGVGQSGNKRIHRRALACGVDRVKGSGPHLPKRVGRVARGVPNTFRVGQREICIALLGRNGRQCGQVAQKNAFELRSVHSEVRLVRVVQHPIGIGQVGDGRLSDGVCGGKQLRRCLRLVQLHQPAEHHPLVIAPHGLPVVGAGRGHQAVIDQVLAVDHP